MRARRKVCIPRKEEGVRIEDVIPETRRHLELEIDAGGETALVLIDGSPALCVYGRGSVNLPPIARSIKVLVGDAAKSGGSR